MPPALASQMSWLGLGMIVLAALTYNDTTVYPGIAVITAGGRLGVRDRRRLPGLAARCRIGAETTPDAVHRA